MLAFNLWFAATHLSASPGQIFSVVSYSLEFLQAAVMLPFALQALTQLNEITERINRSSTAILHDLTSAEPDEADTDEAHTGKAPHSR